MTFNGKIDKLKLDRSLSLTKKIGQQNAQDDAEEERDFNYRYLFGYNGEIGINDLLAIYGYEMYAGVGKDFSTPSLRINSDSAWQTRLELAVTLAGDGDIYLDSNGDGVADTTINPSSEWLGNNTDNGVTTGGLVALCTAVNTAIGEEASQTANGRGPFDTSGEAATHANSTDGSGLLGRRTENSEVYQSGDWYVGQSGTDDPDYYNETERTSLLTTLSNLISSITSYTAVLDSTTTTINGLSSNSLFIDMGILDESHFSTNILGDPSDMATLKATLQGYRSQVQTYYDYFNSFTASDDISGQSGYNRTIFNGYLTTSIPAVMSNITSALQSRTTSILSKLGSTTQGLKRYRYFWAVECVKKPVSPLIIIQSITASLPDVEQAIDYSNTALDLILDDSEQYLSTPEVLSAFYNPFLDPVTYETLTERIKVIWSAPVCSNRYKIYRREYTGFTPNNDNWSDTYLLTWVYSINADTNFIDRYYLDENYTTGKTYIYRVQALDTNEGSGSMSRTDDRNTKSLMSPVYDSGNLVTYTGIVNGLATLSEASGLREGGWCVLLSSSPSISGFYKIDYIDENNNIQLQDTTINDSNTGSIAKAYGVVQV